jgi:hypothetical protein
MTPRRPAAMAASIALITATILGIATPASAEPPVVIPTCDRIFSGIPSYWTTFASVNRDTAVAIPASPLYGSDRAELAAKIAAWGSTTCTWGLAHSPWRTFTISAVALTPSKALNLRNWYFTHGIVGVDREATLGGVAYTVSPTEYDVVMHGRVWISITERKTSVEGYTMQAATRTIAALNPWLRFAIG